MDVNTVIDMVLKLDDAERDHVLIPALEEAWKGLWLPAIRKDLRPGVAVMEAAMDYAYAADEDGVKAWLEDPYKTR
jgi:hypothetical protein